MAGNNSIQLLRGTNISGKTDVLLDGQPAYDKANGALYIGDGTSAISALQPITASMIVSKSATNTTSGPRVYTSPAPVNGVSITNGNNSAIVVDSVTGIQISETGNRELSITSNNNLYLSGNGGVSILAYTHGIDMGPSIGGITLYTTNNVSKLSVLEDSIYLATHQTVGDNRIEISNSGIAIQTVDGDIILGAGNVGGRLSLKSSSGIDVYPTGTSGAATAKFTNTYTDILNTLRIENRLQGTAGTAYLEMDSNGIRVSNDGSLANEITFPSKGGTHALTSNIHKLNGSTTLGQTFYAPTSGGTSGYILQSNGSSAPTWTNAIPATTTIFASQVKLSAAKFGASNLQAFLDKLDDILTGTSTTITGITVSGTVTANTFNATT